MSHHLELPGLPDAQDALAPVISAQTLSCHYGKHHKAYVDNLNRLVAGTDLADATLEQVIAASVGRADTGWPLTVAPAERPALRVTG